MLTAVLNGVDSASPCLNAAPGPQEVTMFAYSGGITLEYRRRSTLQWQGGYIIDGHTIAKRKYRLFMDDGQRLTVE